MPTSAIVLCAGSGTRMKSKKPKVVHEILGVPLMKWAIRAAEDAGADPIVTVVGHKSDEVVPLATGTAVVEQAERLGTAHAVLCAREALVEVGGSVFVTYGDCPLIEGATLRALSLLREDTDAAAAVLTMEMEDPFGYGRIVRDSAGDVLRIVEQKDATEQETEIKECNSGIYCFDGAVLFEVLEEIGNDNAAGEYYLTDAVEILRGRGERVVAMVAPDAAECMGVNSRKQLADASRVLQQRINRKHMDAGVSMTDPSLVWIGPDVRIGQDTEILPMTMLMGATSIGEDCLIGPNTRLTDTHVGNNCTIDETVAIESTIDDGATSGPRAYLRPGAHLMEGAKAGTHVEIKKSTVGPNSKVPHLSYIGDTTIGSGVNIGAGSITCNYDGAKKHPTTIEDNVFVGSDTMMVAPVAIGEGAVVGAGSVITKDVPAGSLAVARARERILEDWAVKHRKA